VVVVGQAPTRENPSRKPSPPAPNHDSSSGQGINKAYARELYSVTLTLYDYQYNVIPVGPDKRPLVKKWSSKERASLGELKEALRKATGLAIVAGPENYWGDVKHYLVGIDVDDPRARDKSPKLSWVLDNTAAWKTGPRCPRCYNKHLEVLEPGRRFKCPTCGLEFTLEEAARGLGALVLVSEELVKKYLGGSTQRLGPVEIMVNTYQLVPPSLHPTGVRYEWIRPLDLSLPNHGLRTLEEEDLKQLLEELGGLAGVGLREARPKLEEHVKAEPRPEARVEVGKLRELQPHEILEIVDALLPAYKPGVRQHIWLFLSGWAAKAGISPVSIAEVLKALHEKTGDNDSLKTRASAIAYSYKKAGVSLEPCAKRLEELLGVKPYGLEKEINEEEVKGKTGLQELLEQVLGEERALDVIRQIEEIFRVASPYKGDSIVELLDYEKQLYAVANLRKLVVVRATRRDGRLAYRERVFEGAPVEVEVYVNPIGGVTKFKVRWATDLRPKPLEIGPAYLEAIVDRLKLEGLVYHSRLASDALSAIIGGFIRRGRAVIKTEVDAPGFYEIDNKIIVVGYEVREPSVEELREALELLNELTEVWFKHTVDRFSTVIKWGAVAPFSYIYKARKRGPRWIFLQGASNSGKTTMALIATVYLWGLRETEHRKAGAFIDTEARLGHILSSTTFPIVVNEPEGALRKEEILAMLKDAQENTKARGKYHGGVWVEYPALASLIFASNVNLPRSAAIFRRFKVLRFTPRDVISQDRVREFEAKVEPRLPKLRALGQFIASYVLKHGLGEDPEAYAVKLLEEAYKAAGLTPPKWLYLEAGVEDVGEVYESIIEQIRAHIFKRVNEEYNRYVGRVDVETSEGIDRRYRWQIPVEERVRIVLEYQLIPWLLDRGEEVIITGGLVEELEEVVGDLGGLRGLAELLGWDYKDRKIGGKTVKVAVTSLRDLVKFLAPPVE
jgi:predicted RNA-binding Zn-ribbon protein involved in translation (DUF1610 family)/DNA-binding Lrp family transcriptional regulator